METPVSALFDLPPVAPEGFRYRDDLVTPAEEAELADRLFLLGRRLQDRGLKLVVTGLERDPPAEGRCKAELRTEPEPALRRPLRCCRSLGSG